MLSRYFCAYHIERMTTCEYAASGYWAETMRRGTQAYFECRLDEAYGCLNAAMEVAYLHTGRPQSGFFEAIHLLKPASLLLQILVYDRRYNEAIVLLSRLSDIEMVDDSEQAAELAEFLAQHYQYVEAAEREVLGVARGVGENSSATCSHDRRSHMVH